MTTPTDCVLSFLDVVDFEKDFLLVLEALYIGFGVSETGLHAYCPSHLMPQLDQALTSLKRKCEEEKLERGTFLHAPDGPVPAALAWLEKRHDETELAVQDSEVSAAEQTAEAAAVLRDASLASPPKSPRVETPSAVPLDLPSDLLQLLESNPAEFIADLAQDHKTGKLDLPPFVVEGMFRCGKLVIVAADGGVGKSFFGDQLAICVASGKPFLGRKTRQMPALYFDCEMGNASQFHRLAALAYHLGVSLDDLPVIQRNATPFLRYVTPEYLERILLYDCHRLNLKLGDCLVVFDNLAALSCGANENSLQDMSPVMRCLREIVEKHGCPCVVFHHTTKDGYDPRGHSSIRDSLDGNFLITGTGPTWYFKCDKGRDIFQFPTEGLVREYIPRPRFLRSRDELDTQQFAGFVWKSTGPVKTKSPESGDKHQQGMSAAEVEHCRAVVRCFRSPDEKVPATELRDRYCKLAKAQDRTAKAAVKDADTHHYTSRQKGGADARGVLRTLTSKGRGEWQKLHGTTAEAE